MTVHPAAVLRARLAQPDDLCLNLFGGPYITTGGCRVEVPEGSKKLLAFVALCGGRVTRRQAAGSLWPEGDDVRAAGNLRSALWRLKGCGVGVLDADKVSVWLRTGTVVDLDIMHSWAARLVGGCPLADDICVFRWRADHLDLLPGWYEDWVTFEREHVRQQLLHALEALAGHLIALGRLAEAVEVATVAVSIEPLRESAQGALVQAHLSEGNVVEARRAYLLYRELLLNELGVEPGDALTCLVASTRSPSPRRGPLGDEVGDPPRVASMVAGLPRVRRFTAEPWTTGAAAR